MTNTMNIKTERTPDGVFVVSWHGIDGMGEGRSQFAKLSDARDFAGILEAIARDLIEQHNESLETV